MAGIIIKIITTLKLLPHQNLETVFTSKMVDTFPTELLIGLNVNHSLGLYMNNLAIIIHYFVIP